MKNLSVFIENLTNGYVFGALDIISILVVLCGILVIINKNPVTALLFLIGLFGGISIYLSLIGLTFLALSYLVVYIGAVSILFLFILMLINIRKSELQDYADNSRMLAFGIAILFIYVANYWFLQDYFIIEQFNMYDIDKTFTSYIYDYILYTTSTVWDGNMITIAHIGIIGNILYTNYNMWLIITSLILLLAMVGAIVITIKQKK